MPKITKDEADFPRPPEQVVPDYHLPEAHERTALAQIEKCACRATSTSSIWGVTDRVTENQNAAGGMAGWCPG
jgi:hypothetical protein